MRQGARKAGRAPKKRRAAAGEAPVARTGGPSAGKPEVLSVPPELEATAHKVMGWYDMRVSNMTIMATKPEKGGAIWKIETSRGPRSLKVLHRSVPRSLFSIGAQEYLVGRGARVPALVPTKDDGISVEVDGKLWIVTDWIENLQPASKVDLQGAAQLCYGLGEFHRLSRQYVPPAGAENASRLLRWPTLYQKVLTKIGWFRHLAEAYPDAPASATLLTMAGRFEQQAREAVRRLEQSPYAALAARGDAAWGLAHQHE